MVPPRVYLVDDDTLVTQSLGTALHLETDWEVSAWNDAREALSAMTAAPPDVVLSDLKMPGMDGIAFLRRVRALHPDAVLMLLTGYGDKESAIAAINDVDLWQYVEKPWNTAEVMLKVRQGLERRDLVSDLRRANADLAARVHQLQSAREQLLAQERLAAVGRVMAGLAHELGNQLGLMGYAQLIIDRNTETGGDGEIAEYARAILRAQERLGGMVREIKDFSRGAPAPVREPADIAQVVQEAATLLRFDRDVRLCGLDLRVEARPLGRINRNKLQQAVINLVRNGAQASPAGAPVLLFVEKDMAGGAVLRVVDHGRGMPPEVLARLGEAFFTTREDGTGLGVGITRRIIEEHGGTIEFRSTPGEGTEAIVRLPPLDLLPVRDAASGGARA